jgi:hypothetical protein
VEWDQGLIDRLDLALNESTACGLRYDAERGNARLLVEVEALPEVGSVDRDPRRAIVLSSVESIEVTVRSDRVGGYGPVLPLGSLDDVEQFFAGLSWAHPMYGWEFVDISDPGPAWQVGPVCACDPAAAWLRIRCAGSPSAAWLAGLVSRAAMCCRAWCGSLSWGSNALMAAVCRSRFSWPTARGGGRHSGRVTVGAGSAESCLSVAEVAALAGGGFGERASWRAGRLACQLSLLSCAGPRRRFGLLHCSADGDLATRGQSSVRVNVREPLPDIGELSGDVRQKAHAVAQQPSRVRPAPGMESRWPQVSCTPSLHRTDRGGPAGPYAL